MPRSQRGQRTTCRRQCGQLNRRPKFCIAPVDENGLDPPLNPARYCASEPCPAWLRGCGVGSCQQADAAGAASFSAARVYPVDLHVRFTQSAAARAPKTEPSQRPAVERLQPTVRLLHRNHNQAHKSANKRRFRQSPTLSRRIPQYIEFDAMPIEKHSVDDASRCALSPHMGGCMKWVAT